MRWPGRVKQSFAARASGQGAADRGFSLVEVLVAITILTIVALFSTRLAARSIAISSQLDNYQTAVAVATMQMEQVRGFDAAPLAVSRSSDPNVAAITAANAADPRVQVSGLFSGRPMSLEQDLFDPTKDPAAALAATTLANTYVEWDPTVTSDSHYPTSGVLIPPSGVSTDTDAGGATIYLDANGTQVYPTSSTDSFGSALWSANSGGTGVVMATFSFTGTTNPAGVKIYRNDADATKTIATNVAPKATGTIIGGQNVGGKIVQSTVSGYPGGVVTLNGTQYETTILLGSCFVATDSLSLTATQNGQCGKVSGVTPGTSYNANAVPTTLTNYAKLVRVIVIVQWRGIGCDSGLCGYALTSEFLPNIKDLTWEVN